MTGCYTQDVKDYYLDYVDNELVKANERLRELRERYDAKDWKKILSGIAREHTYSSRYALMRYVFSKTTGAELGSGDCETEFDVTCGSETYHFKDLSLEHAEELSRKEKNHYRSVLKNRAGEYSERAKGLIDKAFSVSDKGRNTLTREEAFQLGHYLDFSVQEMQWFLLRIFEVDESIRPNSSNDLIDMYGFYRHRTNEQVERIKDTYNKRKTEANRDRLVVEDNRPVNWTATLEKTLEERVREWNSDDDDEFMDWILEQAAWLDQESRTKHEIYANLVTLAYSVMEKDEHYLEPYEVDLLIQDMVVNGGINEEKEKLLFTDGKVDRKKCEKVAGKVVGDFKREYSLEDDASEAFATIWSKNGCPKRQTNRMRHEDSKVTKKRDGTEKKTLVVTSKRIVDLLIGKVQIQRKDKQSNRIEIHDLPDVPLRIEKWDVQLLIWYIYNKVYFSNFSDGEVTENDRKFTGMSELIDSSNYVLDKAGLGCFYPPHIMEQSMLLSIVEAGEGMAPGDIYSELCEAAKKAEKKTTREKGA